jgi:RNA polymerase-binding transcription factor DksA
MPDMMDDIQAYNEFYDKLAFDRQKAQSAPETHPDFDGQHCVECEGDIPLQRLTLGRIRCVECQEHKERTDAAHARNGRSQ